MHPTPLRRSMARAALAVSLVLGLAGAFVLLNGFGPPTLQRLGGTAAATGPDVWRETIRPLLIAGTLFALAAAGTLGLGGSPARRD